MKHFSRLSFRSVPLTIFLLLFLVPFDRPCDEASDKSENSRRKETIDQDHRQLVSDHLALSPEEAKVFWPIYESYVLEVNQYLELRLDYAKHLADQFDHFDDAVGERVIKDMLAIDKTPGRVWEQYLPRFIKAIGGRKTARFYQIERRLRIFVDAELSREFPLIP